MGTTTETMTLVLPVNPWPEELLLVGKPNDETAVGMVDIESMIEEAIPGVGFDFGPEVEVIVNVIASFGPDEMVVKTVFGAKVALVIGDVGVVGVVKVTGVAISRPLSVDNVADVVSDRRVVAEVVVATEVVATEAISYYIRNPFAFAHT